MTLSDCYTQVYQTETNDWATILFYILFNFSFLIWFGWNLVSHRILWQKKSWLLFYLSQWHLDTQTIELYSTYHFVLKSKFRINKWWILFLKKSIEIFKRTMEWCGCGVWNSKDFIYVYLFLTHSILMILLTI